jgi:hypothetical protein
MKYSELKTNKKYSNDIIISTILNNRQEFLMDITLNKQWKVAQELGVSNPFMSTLVQVIKQLQIKEN